MRSSLICSFGPRELELGLLFSQFSIGVFDLEQPLHDFRFGHLQVAIPGPVHIAMGVNPERLCDRNNRFTLPFPSLSSFVRCAVLAIVGVSLRVLQDRRLFDAPALWIAFNTPAADRLNRHALPVTLDLIDGGFDQAHRALAFLLVVFLQPGVGLSWLIICLV